MPGAGDRRRLAAAGWATLPVGAVLEATATGTGIHAASIERLHAPLGSPAVPGDGRGTRFRTHRAPLVRRGRAIAPTLATLEAGLGLVGVSSTLCWAHASRRVPAPAGSGRTWLERTPAMAAGLTDHPWTLRDLLRSRVPLPAWVAPKRRGRPPKHLTQTPILRAA